MMFSLMPVVQLPGSCFRLNWIPSVMYSQLCFGTVRITRRAQMTGSRIRSETALHIRFSQLRSGKTDCSSLIDGAGSSAAMQ
mmetsp:Transcript_71737/g.198025  ORF Transcript_71737/g.198025 Transcript_71737/m.198025 type:complete len:82 (+) Transcript_71737:85-330(+)